ncbi:MAG: hypothetical protein P8074_08165 [Anaerolineales bacterium]
MMGSFTWIANAFRYPAPGSLEHLRNSQSEVPTGAVKHACSAFLAQIERLSLSQWEELYTRTLDLNPQTAPYVGFQTWGENYQRGQFLASLNQAYQPLDIDLDGELPDHIVPILRYLEAEPQPIPELVEVLEPSIKRMAGILRKADPQNPYLDLFEAVLRSIDSLQVSASQL